MCHWQFTPWVGIAWCLAGTNLWGQQILASDLGDVAPVAYQLSTSADLELGVSLPVMAVPTFSPPAQQNAKTRRDERTPISSQAYWLPEQNLASQPGTWSQAGTEAKLAVPLSLAEGNIWLATGGVQYTSINTLAILPDSQVSMPGELWDVELGTMNFREWDNGWNSGTILRIGSASNQPFRTLREMTATAIAFVEIPRDERDAWNLSLFYSPTSQLPYPLPGVAYVWRPSDALTANVGVPFSMQYQSTETFFFSASYFPLTNGELLARWQLNDVWSCFGGYQVVNETYWLSERSDSRERLFLFDQRATLGLERKLFAGLRLDLSGGYAFDRQVFQSESFSRNRRDEINIDPGWIGILQLSWSR